MRTIALLAAVLASVLLAASCSSESEQPSSTSAVAFDDSDVMFLQMMYPHHEQAVEMAALVDGRTDDADVRRLADSIRSAQQPEMDRMTALLDDWGQPAPDAMTTDHGHDGMMTDEQMTSLKQLSGENFDRQWLTLMIEHHSGAITMAQKELAEGTDADAKEMASAIIAGQQQEIDTMQALLG